jgi:hypothetical protein
MNLPYIGQIKGLRQFLIDEHILSPIEVGLASDEDCIDTIIKRGYSFVIPYNGGYTTGDEVLLIPNDALNHAAKFSR